MPSGEKIGVPGGFKVTYDEDGSVLAFPGGDDAYPPSAKMPVSSMYFDGIPRQEDLNKKTDWDARKDYDGQFSILSEEELTRLERLSTEYYDTTEYAIVGNYFNAGLGDAFHIPAPWMKEVKGVRDVSEWFVALRLYPDYISEQFEMQTEISLENLKLYYEAVGDKVDVIPLSGVDYTHQNGLLIGKELFREMFMPHYKKVTDWVHKNTSWKTFAHCCGSAGEILPELIECGFDIVNPVQVSAKGMDPAVLKEKFGRHIVFWGGGCDPQHSMPHLSAEEVYAETKKNAEIFSRGGGFIGGNVHNVQYDVPPENLIAELQALKDTVPRAK
jgi:hypothetical protein